jgi:hypothetical protein
MILDKIFAQDSIVGEIKNPLNLYGGVEGGGLTAFFSNILRLVFVVAGMYALINIIIAGFTYMTAGGDAKKLTQAWDRIWQTLLGLAIIAGSFVLAAIFGYILFGDPMFMLNPVIYGPN